MTENRELRRRKMFKRAHVQPDGMPHRISCTLRNISDTGAALEFPTPLDIPKDFVLHVEIDGISVPCTRVWSKGKMCGAHFTGERRRTTPGRHQVLHQDIAVPPPPSPLRPAQGARQHPRFGRRGVD